MSSAPSDFNARIIEEFRANAGHVGGRFDGTRLLLLHTEGARSAKRHVTPVAYLADGDRYVIFASKAGAPTNPGWYHNLRAHPDTTIEVGTDTLEVTASVAQGDERERLYELQVQAAPQFAEYQARTERQIPVVVLTPTPR
jgi:deazaflavin-dependent oxidoreductase (nitroreductase family)